MTVRDVRVSSRTPPGSLASAISRIVLDGDAPMIRAIGPPAVNQLVKALAITQGKLATHGLSVSWIFGFETTEIEGSGERTVITVRPA